MLEKSVNVPVARYAINNTGRTISFAGRPTKKARSINPSRPMALPKGCKKLAIWLIILKSPI